MKTKTQLLSIYSFLLCLLTYSNAFSQDKSDAKVGVFDFETETIDYGTINKNDDGNKTFVFVNKGNAPIIISNIKSSCGCTAPSFSKKPILPGEKSEIKIRYATSRVGPFSKTITILSNAGQTKKQLKVKGKVLDNSSI